MPEKLSSHDYGCSLGLKDLFFGHHCRFQYSQHPCQGLVGSSWIFSATALIHFRHWQRASGQEGVVWFLTCLQQECWLDVMAFISETGITWKIYIDRYIYIYNQTEVSHFGNNYGYWLCQCYLWHHKVTRQFRRGVSRPWNPAGLNALHTKNKLWMRVSWNKQAIGIHWFTMIIMLPQWLNGIGLHRVVYTSHLLGGFF